MSHNISGHVLAPSSGVWVIGSHWLAILADLLVGCWLPLLAPRPLPLPLASLCEVTGTGVEVGACVDRNGGVTRAASAVRTGAAAVGTGAEPPGARTGVETGVDADSGTWNTLSSKFD